MRTKEIKLCEITTSVLFIGFEGEQNYRRFVIDASEVFADMPDAVPGLAIKPPVGDVYPKAVSRVGNSVIWEVSASDCANEGDGEYQLSFSNGNEIGKVFKGQFRVFDSLIGSGSAPDPISDFVENANAVLGELRDMSASASSLPAGSEPTAELTEVGGHKNLAFGIPAGEQGEPGEPGEPGQDGVSPVVSVTDITGGHRVTIVDAAGTKTFDVMDGEQGDPGQPGVSPSVTVTEITNGHRVAITDASGTETFDVMNGAKGDPGEKGDPGTPADPTVLIDDSSTALDKVWSAHKSAEENSSVMSALSAKYEKPSTGIPASDLASGVIPTVPVQDVQVNGTSILSQGVANVPVASLNNLGAVKVDSNFGVAIVEGKLVINGAGSETVIKGGSYSYYPLIPKTQHIATFYGLAKAAGSDMASSSNAVGTYTDDAKLKIQKMLGLWTPKFYTKLRYSEETGSANIPWTSLEDTPLNIYEQMVALFYQSDTTQGDVWSNTEQWNAFNVQKTGNITFSTGLYLNGKKPAKITLKRFPSCYLIEYETNGAVNTKAIPVDSDVIESLGRARLDPVSSTVKAGCTIEIIISKFC